MPATVSFHDYRAGKVGSSTVPIGARPHEKLGATLSAEVDGYFTPDNSYLTGGYALTAKTLGMLQVAGIMFEHASGYSFSYNRTTGKVQVFSAANTEVAAATNLSALQPAYFRAFGVML